MLSISSSETSRQISSPLAKRKSSVSARRKSPPLTLNSPKTTRSAFVNTTRSLWNRRVHNYRAQREQEQREDEKWVVVEQKEEWVLVDNKYICR